MTSAYVSTLPINIYRKRLNTRLSVLKYDKIMTFSKNGRFAVSHERTIFATYTNLSQRISLPIYLLQHLQSTRIAGVILLLSV